MSTSGQMAAKLAVEPVKVIGPVHAIDTAGAGTVAVETERGHAADHIGLTHEIRAARVAETGAAGPTGNRYGDPAGHTCIAIAGPHETVLTYRTGSDDRVANMRAFALRTLETMEAALDQA